MLNKEGQVLIVNQDSVSWSFPKGHIEQNESAFEAAQREIHEESGVNSLELIKDLGSYQRKNLTDKNDLYSIQMFLFETNQTHLEPIDPHNPEAIWAAKSEVIKLLTAPKDKEFFIRILKEV